MSRPTISCRIFSIAMLKVYLMVLILSSLTGCMWLIGEPPWASLGIFKRTIEYNDDGSIKKEHCESKSVLEGIIGLNLFGKE